MAQYIPKAAVVAEIEKLIKENELYLSENASDAVRFSKTGAYSVLNDLLHFLDTLEVKEVDINKEISQFIGANFEKATIGHKLSLRRVSKHFFELGLKAQKGE